jgi:hypothetical protein
LGCTIHQAASGANIGEHIGSVNCILTPTTFSVVSKILSGLFVLGIKKSSNTLVATPLKCTLKGVALAEPAFDSDPLDFCHRLKKSVDRGVPIIR